MKVIAFYLPQYHPIPENDEWWGNGFTEWKNVAKARPKFRGHYQPHIPADLGFYDLRLEETRIAQAELARQHGIHGFCYHHYWFNGKMLLERPFNEVLQTGKPDFPFCLCWANENWTRQWDGRTHEILMSQDYSKYNPSEHIEWLAVAFKDRRYIRIKNKPLFLIYKAAQIPNIENVIQMWRHEAKTKHGIELYLCSVKSLGRTTMKEEMAISAGFDAVVDFQPDINLAINDKRLNLFRHIPQKIWNVTVNQLNMSGLGLLDDCNIYSYETIVHEWIKLHPGPYKKFPCVAPSWDNSPRKKASAVIQNDKPELFGQWLEAACNRVLKYNEDEHIVFINAWNEWGEGCHMEPDIKFGRRFLEITHEVLNRYTHPIKNHLSTQG
jgi:lipopolysaccharide biosynthesis protein